MTPNGPFRFLVAAVFACGLIRPVAANQRASLRDQVREHGDITIQVISCGPPTGLREVVQFTQLTVEGTISQMVAALTPDEADVFTDYTIDVTRVLRMAPDAMTRSTPGSTAPSPFVSDQATRTQPGPSPLRARLRADIGQVTVEGGTIRKSAGFPDLHVGQHIIVSAYFDRDTRTWRPFGVFEVGVDGRVATIQQSIHSRAYESVDAFAAALAHPPPTTVSPE
jgi:hypothetical protein